MKIVKKKKNWWGIFLALLVDFVEICIGAAITFFSAGLAAPLGILLIVDGSVSMAKTIYKGFFTNDDFSFSDFLKDKVASVTIILCFSGVAAIKEVGSMIIRGIKNVAK